MSRPVGAGPDTHHLGRSWEGNQQDVSGGPALASENTPSLDPRARCARSLPSAVQIFKKLYPSLGWTAVPQAAGRRTAV